ncbi:MAG: hypothetical protein LBU85_04270 [Treponema sp.]|jgi:hypothetical protein|nr:hypothetical protein [Treponema sp.]
MKHHSPKQPVKAKKWKNASNGLTRRGLKRVLIIGSAVLGLALFVFLVLFFTRPKLLWYVDEDLSAAWNRILRQSSPPLTRHEVVSRAGDEAFPKGRFGYIISVSGPRGERVEEAPVKIYRDLPRTRAYPASEGGADWLVLAVDPWMVFRKHQDPEPDRSFIDNSNERGTILLAGANEDAVQAWLSQLLQEKPGVFVQGEALWKEKAASIVREYPFQSGALAYSWVQVWPLVFRGGQVSLYAPLSQARSLPPYRMGLLDATRFPEPEGWDRYGMQAGVLWARRQGTAKQIKKMDSTEKWLKNPRTQTVIANAISWIPAHPSGTPYNTISWESQTAWLRSSYIWQGVDDARSH